MILRGKSQAAVGAMVASVMFSWAGAASADPLPSPLEPPRWVPSNGFGVIEGQRPPIAIDAPAEPPAEPMKPPPPPEVKPGKWYGWQILLTSLASDTLIGVGAGVGQDDGIHFKGAAWYSLLAAGAVGRGLGSTFIHLAHHNPNKAAIGAAIQFGGPALLVIAATAAGCGSVDEDEESCYPRAFTYAIGLPIVLIATAAVDIALAREPGELAAPKAAGRGPIVDWSIAPLVLKPLEGHRVSSPSGLSIVGTF